MNEEVLRQCGLMRCLLLSVGLAWIGLPFRASARADTWCSLHAPGAIFCDDFDRYCTSPPHAPQACPGGSDPDNGAMQSVWEFSFHPCSIMLIGNAFYDSGPFCGRTPNQDHGDTTHAGVALSPYIRNTFGATYNSMMGTDIAPLTLSYSFHGQTGGKVNFANSFMELSRGSSQAAVDFVLSTNCSSCGGESRQYPIICQQQNAPASCAPLSTAPHWASVAVGAVTYLDKDPCHCSGSEHSPSNGHLSFFDGYQWWILRQGLFPGGGSGGSTGGDFLLRNNINQVQMTIRSNSIRVELTCTDPDPDEYSWCDIPRDYTGPFDHLYAGLRAPCRLKNGQWVCADLYDCIKGAPGGGVPTYDNVVVSGGLGYADAGACCFPDTTCVSAFGAGDCQSQGGFSFKGSGTTCQTVACCPPLPPDHDLDGDVDLTDFGWFQQCMPDTPTSPTSLQCSCVDFNHDTRIDSADVVVFLNCLSGSDIPANPGCAN